MPDGVVTLILHVFFTYRWTKKYYVQSCHQSTDFRVDNNLDDNSLPWIWFSFIVLHINCCFLQFSCLIYFYIWYIFYSLLYMWYGFCTLLPYLWVLNIQYLLNYRLKLKSKIESDVLNLPIPTTPSIVQ